MKKIFLLFILIAVNIIAKSQSTIATYSSGSYSINLTLSQESEIFDTLKSRLSVYGTLDSVVIDDEDPSIIDSASYIVFYAHSGTNSFSLGILLTKEQKGDIINYRIEASNETAGGTYSCTGVNCSKCKPLRNWFLGPVIGCQCNQSGSGSGPSYCNHSRGGSGLSINDILAIVNTIIKFL